MSLSPRRSRGEGSGRHAPPRIGGAYRPSGITALPSVAGDSAGFFYMGALPPTFSGGEILYEPCLDVFIFLQGSSCKDPLPSARFTLGS